MIKREIEESIENLLARARFVNNPSRKKTFRMIDGERSIKFTHCVKTRMTVGQIACMYGSSLLKDEAETGIAVAGGQV